MIDFMRFLEPFKRKKNAKICFRVQEAVSSNLAAPTNLKILRTACRAVLFFYAKVLKYKKESFVKHWGLDINGKYIYINDMFSEIIR